MTPAELIKLFEPDGPARKAMIADPTVFVDQLITVLGQLESYDLPYWCSRVNIWRLEDDRIQLNLFNKKTNGWRIYYGVTLAECFAQVRHPLDDK